MLKIAYNLIFHYELFRPTAMIDHVSQLKEIVQKENIHYLILDKDDTLVPVYQFRVQDQKIHQTLNDLHDRGVFIAVSSNSVIVDQKDQPPEMRVNNWDRFFDIHFSIKPKPYNGNELQDLMKAQIVLNPALHLFKKQNVAIVGDRLLTDVHMGNLMGWKSYLVKPLQQTTIKKHGIGVFVMRYFENFLIKRSNFTKYQPSKPSKSQAH